MGERKDERRFSEIKVTCSWGNKLTVRKTEEGKNLSLRIDDMNRPSIWLEVYIDVDVHVRGRLETADGRCNMFSVFNRINEDSRGVTISDSKTPDVWVRIDYY